MGINIDGMLLELLTKNGSDLFITSGHAPTLRVNGSLQPLDMPESTPQEVESIVRRFVSEADFERLEEEQDIDYAYEARLPGFGVRRFRGCAFYQRYGLSIVLRTIPVQIPTPNELLLPKEVMKLIDFHQGLVLVTGPTGSGKTTTLASLVNHINNTRPLHVITIEDPIEFVYPVNKCMVIQRQVGTHVESFSSALRSALREDPDVILVGELRDLDTIQLAITAAETGHLVLGTLHTLSAAQTINRAVNVFPPSRQSQVRVMLAESLRGVLSQQLIPRIDGNSRVVATELMICNSAISTLIREAKLHQVNSAIQTGAKQGMRLMDNSLLELVESHQIDPHEALDRAIDKTTFVNAIRSYLE